jgi:hypothetical protein
MVSTSTPVSPTLTFVRKLLFWSLVFGIVGNGVELILLGHIESPAQWIPLVALVVALPVLFWHCRSGGRHSVRAVQLVMTAFIFIGIAGVGLHYDGNAEFERELHPTDTGATFLRHVAAGATPLLAPGSMVLLGLIGIAQTYRHPGDR